MSLAEHIAIAEGTNDASTAFWRDVMVPKYRRFRSVLVGATALHAMRAFEADPPPAGARILDVGCGFGETAIALARRVGPDGSVTGLDPCPAFLEGARADAHGAGVRNLELREGDAQTMPLAGFDRVFSAFGVMFFAQPVAALRNLRAALVAGGRMQLLVWDAREENPWLTLAVAACTARLPPVPPAAPSCGPGPFSMSDPDVLAAMLVRAGLRDVDLRRQRIDVRVGDDIETTIDFQLELGPAGERMRVAGAHGTPAEAAVRAELRQLLAPHRRPDGSVWLPSSVWCASAQAG